MTEKLCYIELQQLQLFQKNKSKMAAEEIDKFVRKFKDLWHSGLDAHLDIDAHAGEAWVGLRVRVGGSPNTFCPKSEKSRDSPSKERRRVRRAAMREEQSSGHGLEAQEEEKVDESVNPRNPGYILQRQTLGGGGFRPPL